MRLFKFLSIYFFKIKIGKLWPFDYILWEKLKLCLLKIFLIPLLWNNFKQVKTAIRYQIQKKNQISTFSISVQFYSIFLLCSKNFVRDSLHEKCPYFELFWSTLSHIRTKDGEILRIYPYSVRIRENADLNNS